MSVTKLNIKRVVISLLITIAIVSLAVAGLFSSPGALKPIPIPMQTSLVSTMAVPGGAVIDNGVIQLGVNQEGHLNFDGGTPSNGTSTTVVGIRYMPTNADAVSPGCLCEGWGAADFLTGITGYANSLPGSSANINLLSFSNTTSEATSTVTIGNTLRVTHYYHPSNSPNLYQADVTITNIGSNNVELLYRRVMDWDIEPTAFNEYVTIDTGNATNIIFTSDNGFASANPLAGQSNLGYTGSFFDAGPKDHGALFDFNFGNLSVGATKTFKIYYGAAATEAQAIASLATVGAEAYSFGQPNTSDGQTLGKPNTFIFAFSEVGGTPMKLTPSVDININKFKYLTDDGGRAHYGSTSTVKFGDQNLVPLPDDIAVLGSSDLDGDGVPEVGRVSPLTITKDLTKIGDAVSINLTINWSDGTTRAADMTEIGTSNVWTTTFDPYFPSGVAHMRFEADISPAGPGNEDVIEIGDIVFIDPSGQIRNSCTKEPINGANVLLMVESPSTGNFTVSPSSYQIPSTNPLTIGTDGIYSWMTEPGTYKVIAEAIGYITGESPTVTVPPEVTDLDIELTPVSGCGNPPAPVPELKTVVIFSVGLIGLLGLAIMQRRKY